MEEHKNIKKILFLLGLCSVAIVSIIVVRNNIKTIKTSTPQESINLIAQTDGVTQGCSSEIPAVGVGGPTVLGEEDTIDISESVKGAGSQSCEEYNKKINVRRLCTQGSTQTKVDKGSDGGDTISGNKSGGEIRIDDDVEVTLTKVTFPAQFWNGKKFVKTSNLEISKEDPVYNSSGDYLDVNALLKLSTPEQSEALTDIDSGRRSAFDVVAENYVVGAQEESKILGEYIVQNSENQKYQSACQSSIQPSDFNPTVTNKMGTALDSVLQIPKGDPVSEDLDLECLSEGGTSEKITTGLETVCQENDLLAKFFGAISTFFSGDQWSDCTTPVTTTDDEGNTTTTDALCVSPEQIVIQMSSIFGSLDVCQDGVCANIYMTRKFKGTQTPVQSNAFKVVGSSSADSLSHSILTPCNVEFKSSKGTKEVPVYCMWDATPTIMNYRAQAIEKIPGDPTFPSTFESYWDLVKQAVVADTAVSLGQ